MQDNSVQIIGEKTKVKIALANSAQEKLGFKGYLELLPPMPNELKPIKTALPERSLASVLNSLNIDFVSCNTAQYYFEAETLRRLELRGSGLQQLARLKTAESYFDKFSIYYALTMAIALFASLIYMLPLSLDGNFIIPFGLFVAFLISLAPLYIIETILGNKIGLLDVYSRVENDNLANICFTGAHPELIQRAIEIKDADSSAWFFLYWFNDLHDKASEEKQALKVCNNSGEEWFILPQDYKNVFL